MKKTIGLFAHVDAGKTTLSEQILYNTGSIRSLGKVDAKNTILDNDNIERLHGITIFSGIAEFKYKESEYYLVDTPGHIDFCAETERAISVIDYAILIISAVEGIQGHTITLWKLLEEYKAPIFIFINKTDRIGARTEEIIKEIKLKLSADIITENELIEKTAENDDILLDMYLKGQYDETLWLRRTAQFIKDRKIFLCLSGSAINNEGVDELLSSLEKYSYTDYNENAPFSARVFKVKYDNKDNRNVFMKILSGGITPREKISAGKIFEIRKFTGAKYKSAEYAPAGTICAVTGLNGLSAGDIIGTHEIKKEFHTTPVLVSKVIFPKTYSINEILKIFKKFEDEEPLLKAEWQEYTKELKVHLTGVVQIEILKELIKDRFNIDIDFGACEVLYMETVNKNVIGCGHFEPLKHYAEVHLMISPEKRGSGITFESCCPTDILDKNFQNLIRTHIFEKTHKGVLTGSPLTDVKITLLTGRAHIKHTEGGDFREAVYRAVRHGLFYAQNILLEPLYHCTISVPPEYMGRILSDIQKMSGSFETPKNENGVVIIKAHLPVSKSMDYPKEFQNETRGQGQISISFGGYAECHNTDEIIDKYCYNPENDIENTADSVFCSHGSGFIVKWQDAKNYMHCSINDK